MKNQKRPYLELLIRTDNTFFLLKSNKDGVFLKKIRSASGGLSELGKIHLQVKGWKSSTPNVPAFFEDYDLNT